jgi:UDP-glucose 4-epimerase
MKERCLVTGGAGFIGSHLVDRLLAEGYAVRVLDDFSTGDEVNIPSPVELVSGSITDPAAVAEAVKGCQVVYHLAAMASVAKSLENPVLCHAVCGTGTLNVLEASRQAGVRRVVYSASSSAYGAASDPAGQDEETPLRPLSPYASAKLNGDGLQARDFVAVGNAVQALMLAANTPGVSGRVYNVGTGRSINLLELLAALNRELGTKAEPEFSPARVGDVRFSLAKIERIRTELGYDPRITFEEGLRLTINWYKSTTKGA